MRAGDVEGGVSESQAWAEVLSTLVIEYTKCIPILQYLCVLSTHTTMCMCGGDLLFLLSLLPLHFVSALTRARWLDHSRYYKTKYFFLGGMHPKFKMADNSAII